ncbi:hypothetical protein GOODEAATRI_008319 [Goodea atripinnis]|uniref:Uncharacterized protein n=1 Tax=Goodea atripinnis TaxID=208336 RepID=A0ABV0N8Y6_9TELE
MQQSWITQATYWSVYVGTLACSNYSRSGCPVDEDNQCCWKSMTLGVATGLCHGQTNVVLCSCSRLRRVVSAQLHIM